MRNSGRPISHAPPPPDDPSRDRIVEVIFAGDAGRPGRRLLGSISAMSAVYGGLIVLAVSRGPSTTTASVETARAAALANPEWSVDLAVPPSPPPRMAPAVLAARAPGSGPQHTRGRSDPRDIRSRPEPLAQAGAIAAAASEPADFTGMPFVVGSGASYAGGTTSSTGTGQAAAPSGRADPGSSIAAVATSPMRARPVALDRAAWTCPWPDEADSRQIDEQTVVLRARVDASGQVQTVAILADPGAGFAEAARSCALRTRFQPARDASGVAIAAFSPPIRVHFFR